MYSLTLVRGFANNARKAALKHKEINNKPFRDVFGTLSETGSKTLQVHKTEKELPEDPDGYDKVEYDLAPRKNWYYYKYKIREHARIGTLGIRKALELYHEMKSVARLTPEYELFPSLILGCAKAGYTKKAFELYEDSLKSRGKAYISPSIVTCLLNACAECPFPEYGLKRLDWFMAHYKISYNSDMNLIQYNSAIKAYGKLGQLDKASNLVAEMITKSIYPDTATFNMLLIGCASNKVSGSTLALRIFKRMKLYGIRPDNNTYELMLRCIRDCGTGSQELVNETLGELPAMTSLDKRIEYKQRLKVRRHDKFANFAWAPVVTDLAKSIDTAIKPPPKNETSGDIGPITHENEITNLDTRTNELTDGLELSPSTQCDKLPNLLSDDHLKLIYRIKDIQVGNLRTSIDRMILFGGFLGYLEAMMKDGCRPGAKAFSLILPCIKPDKENLLEYLDVAKRYSIKRDLLFYDLLIRHACNNPKDGKRLETALQFLEEMHYDGIRPNISTFESLALGCATYRQAEQLIADVQKSGFTVSNVMIKRLFDAALFKTEFYHLIKLVQLSMEFEYKPPKQLVEVLEEKRVACHSFILRYEKGLLAEDEVPKWISEKQIKLYDQFNTLYKKWLKSVELLEEEHPWKQFHVESGSKRQGFVDFTKDFRALIEAKEEAMEKEESFGNLAKKAALMRKNINQCR